MFQTFINFYLPSKAESLVDECTTLLKEEVPLLETKEVLKKYIMFNKNSFMIYYASMILIII